MKSLKLLQTILTALTIIGLPILGVSQVHIKIRKIDSLVSQINSSKYTEIVDTANNDMPAYSIFMTTFQTAISDGSLLKKYIHRVLNFKDQTKKVTEGDYASIFYYEQDTLIKVEESAVDKHGHFNIFWYFDNNRLINFQVQPMPIDDEGNEKIKNRERIIRGLSVGFLAKFHSKHPSS